MAEQTITCPNCGQRIPISKALTSQIEAGLRKTFKAEAARREKETEAAFKKRLIAEIARSERQARKEAEQAASAKLSKMQLDLTQAKKREKATEASFDRRLAEAKSRLEKQTRKEIKKEISAELAELQEQVWEKDKQIARGKKNEAEILKLQNQIAAREKAMEAEITRRVDKASRKAREETAAKSEAQHRSHELQLEKQLSDARRQTSELKRKLELSSQQAQGEVMELELKKTLKQAFPDDKIEPIAKGKIGADVLQKVYAPNGQYCGTIIWEAKNTRNWSKAWLGKLRSDQRRAKAELAVLVTAVLPKGISNFAQVDGVWVTEFPLVMGVATAFRIQLMQISSLKQSSKGKHEKMELMYEYLAGVEFRQRVEAIVEAFVSMRDDLDKERQTMERQWAKREKNIQLVIENISGMYGEMQAIAGQALPKIRRLELPSPRRS